MCVSFPLANSPLTTSLCSPSQRLKALQTKAASFQQAEYTKKFKELFEVAVSSGAFNDAESQRISRAAREHAETETANKFGDMAEQIAILEGESMLLSSLRPDLESTLLANDTHQLAVYLREAAEKVELLAATKTAVERQLGKKPRSE